MDFFLDKDQRLQRALANNNVVARSLDADSDMQLSGASSLEVLFQANADSSVLKQMQAGQRSTITLSAPKSKANDPRAANKRITATMCDSHGAAQAAISKRPKLPVTRSCLSNRRE